MNSTFERVQMLIRPDQKKELMRRARDAKRSVAEITRQMLDSGIQKAREEDEFAKTSLFIKRAEAHREKMPAVSIDLVEILNDIREGGHE
ncbi:MAG: hypothetical protein GYA15_05450 [Leptolinea sp.]|jgi:hypothetical protein|nr:hypothetical protein [Leptolinea sp.]